MTITAVGSTQQAGASTGDVGSLTVTMGSLAVGDYLVIGIIALDTDNPTVAGIAGGGVPSSGPGSWALAASTGVYDSLQRTAQVWVGQIAALTPAGVTVHFSDSSFPSVSTARVACQQFHSSVGSLTTSASGDETSDTGGALASGTYPSLTGTGLYFGCGLFNGSASGSSAGFTYINGIGGGTGGAVVWDASASGTSAPAWSQSGGASNWGTCAVLLSEATMQIVGII